MSLETLWEAAIFVEHETDDTKSQQSQPKVAMSVASTGCSSKYEARSSEMKQPNATETNEQSASQKQSSEAITKDVAGKTDHCDSGDIANPTAVTSAFVNQASKPDCSALQKKTELLNVQKPIHRVATDFAAENVDEANLSQSNMDPLFARARAAVKNASFGDNEGIIIPPPRHIPGSALTISAPRGVIIDQFAYQPSGGLSLSLPQRFVPVNVTSSKPATPVTVLNTQKKSEALHSERTVSILPSIKTNVDANPVFSSHQLKPVKRNVTLTHNQLEKNRRAHLKECFEALKAAIPRLGMRRSSNLTILKAALKQIQVLKRKSATHQRVLAQLCKEKEDKRRKEAALLKELLKTADRKKIELSVAEYIRKSAKTSPPISLLDASQLSTSTASEAEDEEERQNNSYYNEILFRPISANPSPVRDRMPAAVHRIQANAATNQPITESKIVRSISGLTPSTVYIQNPPPRNDISPRVHSQTPVGDRTAPTANNSPVRNKVLRLVVPQRPAEISSVDSKPRKSSIRSHPPPVRRSATPTPSSDVVHFFPRFSMGGGCSPPLMSSPKFEFMNIKPKQNEKQPEINALDHNPQAIGAHSATALVNAHDPSSAARNFQTISSEHSVFPPVTTSDQIKHETGSSSVIAGVSSQSDSRPAATTNVSSSPSKTVIVTSFTGYEVKVKYLNTSVTSAPSFKAYQARVPMKKRPVNVESFTSQLVDASKTRPLTSGQVSAASSELKMTSLYVGASASLLDSVPNSGLSSTSDHESDRESPFLDHKNAKLAHHWRKNMLNEQTAKEAEIKNKSMEKNKKRTFQVHQYEAPDPKCSQVNTSKTQNEAKRKATFNLWDRKHHAITMTTATNWRGKQQLISTKPKASSMSATSVAAEGAARSSQSGNAVTTVSYSLLQKTAKPSVPSSLLSSRASTHLVTASSMSLAGQQSVSVTNQPDPSRTAPSAATASENSGIMSLPDQRLQPVAVQLPNNHIGYHILQPSPGIPTSLVQGTSSAPTDVSTMNGAVISPVPTRFLPTNFPVASDVNSASTSESAKTALPACDAAALLQQTALITAQTNPLQMSHVPYVFPVSYVMYPPGIPANGVQLATVQQQPAKILSSSNLTAEHSTRPPLKRPASPSIPAQPPSRNASNGSASSTTLSADSIELDGNKNTHNQLKKIRFSDAPSPSTHPNVIMTPYPQRLPQSQFFVPGNPSFMVAAPTSNGFNLPLNILGYPLQTYPGAGALQALPMPAGLAPGQALHGISQMWPMGQAVLPTADAAGGLASMATNTTKGNSLAAPFQRSAKVD